jgi:HEAT repeat protein
MRHGILTRAASILAVLLTAGCGGDRGDGPYSNSEGRRPGWVKPPAPPPAVPAYQPVPIDDELRQQARSQILASARSNDPLVRAHVIEAIRQAMPTDPDARTVIVEGLFDKSAIVRFASAMGAGELRVKEAKAKLDEMVNDSSRNVRIAVRFALHRLGDVRHSHDFEKTAQDPSPRVRANTAVALGLLEEPSALNVLRPMQDDRDPNTRLQVAEAMWRLGSEQGRDSLVGATVSKYSSDQMIAFMGLAATRDQRMLPHIRPALTDEYEEVRLVAARACGMLGSDDGYGVAVDAARNVDKRKRSLAALALGAIGRSDAQPALANLMKDPDADVCLSAATAILQLKPPPPTAVTSG